VRNRDRHRVGGGATGHSYRRQLDKRTHPNTHREREREETATLGHIVCPFNHKYVGTSNGGWSAVQDHGRLRETAYVSQPRVVKKEAVEQTGTCQVFRLEEVGDHLIEDLVESDVDVELVVPLHMDARDAALWGVNFRRKIGCSEPSNWRRSAATVLSRSNKTIGTQPPPTKYRPCLQEQRETEGARKTRVA